MKPEDYIKGDRMGREARDLERRAMDDPFLRDALEGYDAVPGDHADAIERIRGRVAARTRRRLLGARTWAVAASLLLVLGVGGYLIVRIPPTEPMLTHAPQVQPPQATEATISEDESQQEQPSSKMVMRFLPPVVTADCEIVEECCAQEMAVPVASEAKKTEAAADKRVVSAVMDAKAVVPEVEKAMVALEATKQLDKMTMTASGVAAKESLAARTGNMVSGVVTDSVGNALPGATVVVEGTRRGVVTDARGRYSLDVAPGDRLEVGFLGYIPQQITVSQPVHDIAMAASPAMLAEVAVTGYAGSEKSRVAGATTVAQRDSVARAIARSEKHTPSIMILGNSGVLSSRTAPLDSVKDAGAAQTVKAEPAGGMRAYKKYLKENLIRPAECVCSKAGGKVTLRFDTDALGRPVDIRVVWSRCPACDREAMRLLRAGPRWTPSTAGVQLDVVF